MDLKKYLIVCSFIATNAMASTQQLTNFNDLLEDLNQGQTVRAIIHFNQCQVSDAKNMVKEELGPTGGFNFDVFAYYKIVDKDKGERYGVATAINHFTIHRTFGPTNEFSRLRVFADNTAEYYEAMLDPKTYELKATITFNCRIDNGAVVLVTNS